MLKLTIKDLLESMPQMQALAAKQIRNPKLAYNIGKTWRAMKSELDNIRDREIEIFKEFGGVEDESGNIRIPDEDLTSDKRKDFNKRIEDLHAVNIEVWGTPLSIIDLEGMGAIEISGEMCASLHWLIVESIEPAPAPAEG